MSFLPLCQDTPILALGQKQRMRPAFPPSSFQASQASPISMVQHSKVLFQNVNDWSLSQEGRDFCNISQNHNFTVTIFINRKEGHRTRRLWEKHALREAPGRERKGEKPKVLSPIFPFPRTGFKVKLKEVVLLAHTCPQLVLGFVDLSPSQVMVPPFLWPVLTPNLMPMFRPRASACNCLPLYPPNFICETLLKTQLTCHLPWSLLWPYFCLCPLPITPSSELMQSSGHGSTSHPAHWVRMTPSSKYTRPSTG